MAWDDTVVALVSKYTAATHNEMVSQIKARVLHSLSTAENDVLVGSGSNTWIKKTLAEFKTILGLGSAAYTDSTAYTAASHASSTSNPHSVTAAQTGAATTSTKLDDFATPDDNTDLNANTTNHGLLLKATAPAANVLNVVGIANGETAYANKALFDATNPAMNGTAAPGTSLYAAHRDHVHASDTSRIATADIDTDSTFAANSDSKVPSQKAVKTANSLIAPRTRAHARVAYVTDSGGTEKQITSTAADYHSPANGDILYFNLYGSGNETKIDWTVSKGASRGILDLYINGVLDSSGYDLYNATTSDTLISITLTRAIVLGWNEIKFVVNGKNASSSGYYTSNYGVRLR